MKKTLFEIIALIILSIPCRAQVTINIRYSGENGSAREYVREMEESGIAGRGWYQEWGKPAVQLIPGTIIEIPEGAKHWHGAAADSWMQHLTFHKDVQDGASNEWLEPVSEEQYQRVR